MQNPVDSFERISNLSPRRLALLAMELQDRLDAVEQARREPIAIVGIGCRFPGGAMSPDLYRDLLARGANAVVDIPRQRWDIDARYDPEPGKGGKIYARHGGFLAQVDEFDASFFGISPREAAGIDPQHRVLLETSWHALENACISPDRLSGSATGVFIGIGNNDYAVLAVSGGDFSRIDAYLSTGNTASAAAGRISYFLGLQGPSMAVDTACSSSLVAVHLACQSLRAGECGLALAGGVNLVLSPTSMLALSALRMLAPDGRCKTFDARADGFVRGEGCGVVVLKRLSEAEQAGDRVLGVILGSAVNQDGRSSGLTAPNGPAQESVIRRALQMAQVEPSEVQYVEAHGTGTKLGDPIEVQALNGVLGEGRKKEKPLRIGSVKTNIGHLEAAAGIAGLIKVVLALGEEKIPPQLHFVEPNPHIEWDRMAVEVVTEAMPWHAGRRVAGVSSFGVSGTNAHVVLEAPSAPQPRAPQDSFPYFLAISAKSAQTLRVMAEIFANYLESTQYGWRDICYTSAVGRAHFAQRLAITADSPDRARRELISWGAGRKTSGLLSGSAFKADKSIPETDYATAYVNGTAIDWARLFQGSGAAMVPLPLYPFKRQHFWFEGPARQRSEISDWFYEIQWQVKDFDPPPAVRNEEPGGWLIVSKPGPLAEHLAKALEESGDFARVALAWTEVPRFRGVVYLSSLEQTDSPEFGAEMESALNVLTALARRPGSDSPRLWIVTENCQPGGGYGHMHPAQALYWGLGRTIAVEHPEIWGGLVDLDFAGPEQNARELLAQLRARDGETQVAFREGCRYVPRFSRAHGFTGRLRVHSAAAYLISGGSGAIGTEIARELVMLGARNIVLLSRRGQRDDSAGDAGVREMELAGARIIFSPCDVSRIEDVERVLSETAQTMPPVRGIFHAAGVLDDAVLLQQTGERFRAVMNPKAVGAWNLHCASLHLALDYFVMCSSTAALFGSAGQANYCAANAFLDALSHYRRELGLAAISVNWGPWAAGGMASTLGRERLRRWADQGIGAIPPEEGRQAVREILCSSRDGIAVVPVDWEKVAPMFAGREIPPLFSELARQAGPDGAASPPAILSRIEKATPDERLRLLTEMVRDEVFSLLGFELGGIPRLDEGFFEMGLDSLMAIELKNRLQSRLRRNLPSTIVFEYSNIHSLSLYLAGQPSPLQELPLRERQTGADADDLLLEVENLSEESMTAFVAEQFRMLEERT